LREPCASKEESDRLAEAFARRTACCGYGRRGPHDFEAGGGDRGLEAADSTGAGGARFVVDVERTDEPVVRQRTDKPVRHQGSRATSRFGRGAHDPAECDSGTVEANDSLGYAEEEGVDRERETCGAHRARFEEQVLVLLSYVIEWCLILELWSLSSSRVFFIVQFERRSVHCRPWICPTHCTPGPRSTAATKLPSVPEEDDSNYDPPPSYTRRQEN